MMRTRDAQIATNTTPANTSLLRMSTIIPVATPLSGGSLRRFARSIRQRLPHAIRDHGRIVVDRQRHGALRVHAGP